MANKKIFVPPVKPVERIIGEGNIQINGEKFEYKPGGKHIRGGVSYQFSELRVNFENDVVKRQDAANFINSWLTDLVVAYDAFRKGDNITFNRAYETVTKSMFEQVHIITYPEERIVFNEGKNIDVE